MAKIQCNVVSYTLKRAVDIQIILPTVTIFETINNQGCHKYPYKYPVVYMLHGYGNNYAQLSGYTNLELYAEERQIAIVMISGENKMYINHKSDEFAKFIQEELIEFVTNTFPISNQKSDTYIAGLSMGGFGALYHGLSRADLFQAVGAFSPAIEMEGNPINLLQIIKDTDTENQKYYISCGDQDFVFEQDKLLIQWLEKKNIEYTWVIERGYGHEWRFWDLCMERFLDWLPRTDHYANKKRSI